MNLHEKIKNKNAVMAVIGLGYVGLPLAVEISKSGYKTIGLELDKEKVNKINEGINYIKDIDNDIFEDIITSRMMTATSDFKEIAKADVVCIAVPTPLDKYQQPDLSYIKSSLESMLPYMHKDMLIILESTTYPGTTEEVLKPALESSGMKCGVDFYLAFSPERVDPGNKTYNTKNTPKVVGGVTDECTKMAAAMYESILEAPIHKVSSPAVAEMEKLLENTYRNINIGLINELAILSNKMNINIWEVIDAAKTKPYGFQAFYPGPGLGGHCIPLDPYYLSWKAREYGVHTSMIESSMTINDRMPEYTVNRAMKILNRFGKAISKSTILILGIAYKKDIDDHRESPAIDVIEELEKLDANIKYYDPYISTFDKNGKVRMSEKKLNRELLNETDLIIITTDHTDIDYNFIQKNSQFIFDTKNAMKNVKIRKNIELL
ncbi:MAG: nucleotide sugar dehydrogenase [Acholeplasmatales bacterium]